MKQDKLKNFADKGKTPVENLDEKEISQKDGLYEKVDKKLMISGKQLLREQLWEK